MSCFSFWAIQFSLHSLPAFSIFFNCLTGVRSEEWAGGVLVAELSVFFFFLYFNLFKFSCSWLCVPKLLVVVAAACADSPKNNVGMYDLFSLFSFVFFCIRFLKTAFPTKNFASYYKVSWKSLTTKLIRQVNNLSSCQNAVNILNSLYSPRTKGRNNLKSWTKNAKTR